MNLSHHALNHLRTSSSTGNNSNIAANSKSKTQPNCPPFSSQSSSPLLARCILSHFNRIAILLLEFIFWSRRPGNKFELVLKVSFYYFGGNPSLFVSCDANRVKNHANVKFITFRPLFHLLRSLSLFLEHN